MKTERHDLRFDRKVSLIASILFIVAAFSQSVLSATPARVPASFDAANFQRARDVIKYTKDEAGLTKSGKPKKPKNIPESALIEYFQDHPEALKQDLANVVRELNEKPYVVDTTKHVRLIPPAGRPGYGDLRVFVSHPYRLGDGPNDKKMPADNIAQVWVDFVRQAKKEIVMNVYEFDFELLADELIKAHQRKISVRVGIDADPLKKRSANRELADKMKKAGITVVEVDAALINHQKMIAIDWSDPNLARALFSSGNFTHSCMDPNGDLYSQPRELVVKSEAARTRSIPNANHTITMKSWLAANLINHELTKTFSVELGLRGSSYPTTGSYQITGPGVNPQTFEAYPENSFIIAFTPGGGYRDVNRNLLAYLIKKSEGPVRMVQFAYSSKDISQALLERAERDIQRTGKFDFQSVGDATFAMQGYSQFLKMSGYKREGSAKKKDLRFLVDTDNAWTKSLPAEQMTALRKNVRVAPSVYGKTTVRLGDSIFEVNAKIHHKLMSMGDFAVIGTSFNFSEGAEKNNEQVLIFRDRKMASLVRGITAELAAASPRSVAETAESRNARAGVTSTPADDTEVDENATIVD